jgi:hypothetical protein
MQANAMEYLSFAAISGQIPRGPKAVQRKADLVRGTTTLHQIGTAPILLWQQVKAFTTDRRCNSSVPIP